MLDDLEKSLRTLQGEEQVLEDWLKGFLQKEQEIENATQRIHTGLEELARSVANLARKLMA